MPTKVLKKHKPKQKQKQKQRQSQSVIVKIDQSKRVVQRRIREQPRQQITQQPAPMNVMISPPHLSVDEARQRSNVVSITPLTTPQNQATQQMSQQQQPPRQTLIPVHVYPPAVDFEEDVPVIVNDQLGGSDKFTEVTRAMSPLRERQAPATSLGAGMEDEEVDEAVLPQVAPRDVVLALLERQDLSRGDRNRLESMLGQRRLSFTKKLRQIQGKYQ